MKYNIKSNLWRKTVLFSATFLCLAIVSVGCKKKGNPLGETALPEGSLLSSDKIDTFSLQTYTIAEDSISTKHPRFGMVGSYNDAEVGTFEASYYTQINISASSPNFGTDAIVIDSFVLGLNYGGYYGKLDPQTFEVYELTEDLDNDETYYAFSNLTHTGANLVPNDMGQATITPVPLVNTIVGDDTIAPQIRIPLDTNLARVLINESITPTVNAYDSPEAFQDYFKGLYIKVNNGAQAQGEGGVLYFTAYDALSKLTIYYQQGGDNKTYDFVIGSGDVDFTHIDTDSTGTNLEQILADSTLGQVEFYAQSTANRAVVNIPGLKDLPENIVLHEAVLELPVTYFSENEFYPSTEISLASELIAGDNTLYSIGTPVTFNGSTKSYRIDLRAYIQNVLNENLQFSEILVSPNLMNTSAERIVFNGTASDNKKKPSLTIKYTTY